jgi:hypothetical protein
LFHCIAKVPKEVQLVPRCDDDNNNNNNNGNNKLQKVMAILICAVSSVKTWQQVSKRIDCWVMVGGCCFLIVIVLENPCDGHVNLCSEFSDNNEFKV